jgi:uncharacterized protein (TIGR03663 family)
MKKTAFAGLLLLLFLAAFAFRTQGLSLRPMHHDEANQALKFGALLESGEYRYDRQDHHGPSLYYFSLPLARLLGERTLADLTERTLRLVPALFGLGAILLFLLFLPELGRPAVLWSGLALAFSPVMVYFSRFYIQETLLVFFLVGFIAFLWRYLMRPSWFWALAAGIFAGLMYATKETSVIAFGAIAAALILTRLFPGKGVDRDRFRPRPRLAHLWLGLAGAALTVLAFFTSFFQNPGGFLDSLLTFRVYFVRAGEGGFHLHSWSYYFQILAFSRGAGTLGWSEAFLLILAIAGGAAAFKVRGAGLPRPRFLRFVLFYTAVSTIVYSLIPYKTPWNLLPFYVGFILLAGSGAAFLLEVWPRKAGRSLVVLLLGAGFINLGIQSYRANFRFPADPRNPYAYAQTSPDFSKLAGRVERLASLDPDGRHLLIKVVASPYETWPLPWSLRSFDRVGYWPSTEDAGGIGSPPLVISSAEEAAKVEASLVGTYRSEYYSLRPNVFLVLHVRDDLWERLLETSTRK